MAMTSGRAARRPGLASTEGLAILGDQIERDRAAIALTAPAG